MALDSIDLYISPFYYQAAPFPEADLNADGTIDLMDLNAANSKYPIVQDYYYSPFGELWQGERATDTNPFRYCGEYHDKETGNIYLRARYYNPSIGRFISVDPIKDGTNWYVYCSNNPIAFVDPSGLDYYIFYKDSNQHESAIATEQQIKKEDQEAVVHLIEAKSNTHFQSCWSQMGIDSDGNETYIDAVFVMVHGTHEYLEFAGSEGAYVKDLDIKNIGTIVLTACNTGNLNSSNNVAAQFAMTQNVDQVIAPDGYGYFIVSGHVKSEYLPSDEYIEREGLGFCLFQNMNNNLYVTQGVVEDSNAVPVTKLYNLANEVGDNNRMLRIANQN